MSPVFHRHPRWSVNMVWHCCLTWCCQRKRLCHSWRVSSKGITWTCEALYRKCIMLWRIKIVLEYMQISNTQQIPHTLSSRASYGIYIVKIWEKIDCIATTHLAFISHRDYPPTPIVIVGKEQHAYLGPLFNRGHWLIITFIWIESVKTISM